MTLKSGPGLGLLVNAAPGEGHYNELTRLLRGLDALIQPNVISRVPTVPTSGMADGDRYLLTGAPNAGAIARYSTDLASPAWEYFTPRNGWYVWSIADQKGYRFKGATAAWGEESTGGSEALGTAAPVSGALNLADATKSIWNVSLTGNVTAITLPSNIPVPLGIMLNLTQDSTGGRTVTWPSSVTWQSGAAPAINVTAGARTVVSLLTTDGGSTWLGFYDFQGGTLGRALNEAPIISSVSSGTLAIGAVASNTIQVTGTTAITAFDTAPSGAKRMLRFSDALVLTYDATKLILPGQANITTVAGDVAEFVSLGSGNWVCYNYQRATKAGMKSDLGLTKADVGLANADNTSDASKPISTATQSALDAKAAKGVNNDITALQQPVTAPTPAASDNSTRVQTTAGSLLQMQQFGLGGNGAVTQLTSYNDAPVSGFFKGSAAATTGVPAGTDTTVLYNARFSATGSFQLAGNVTPSVSATRMFVRSQYGGTFYDWREVAMLDAPSFVNGVTSTGDKNTFTSRGTATGNQTGMALTLPAAPTDKRTFEWLSSTSENGRMTFRTINDAYSAGHEFMIAYRSTANDHTMERVTFRAVNVVVGQSDQLNSTYRLQALGGIYATGPVRVGQYTLSTLPSASAYPGAEIDVTDAAGGAKRCRSDGTNWKILNTTTTVS